MNRKPITSKKSKLIAGVLWALASLVVAWWLDASFPFREALIKLIRVRSNSVADWLSSLPLPDGLFTPLVLVAIAFWLTTKFLSKALIFRVWQASDRVIHDWLTPTPIPAGCVLLSDIQRKLYPEEEADGKPLELFGREEDLQWLQSQVMIAQTTIGSVVRVLLLWGPQGIGKTHILFRFATDLVRGQYKHQIRGKWQAWGLNREFDPKAVADSLPDAPTLLLWDDIALNDESSQQHLSALFGVCAGRKHLLIVALSSWRPRFPDGLTRGHILVDAEREVGQLDLTTAQRIYAGAAELPERERGHPLLLRLLSRQAASGMTAAMPLDLWESCRQWACEFTQRLEKVHNFSPSARHALAVASSCQACTWPQVQLIFGLDDTDRRALEKTGRLRSQQGAVWLEPVRPDLLGWAYALHVLAMIPLQDAERWAALAWKSGSFEAGRFLQFSRLNSAENHLWVEALNSFGSNDFAAMTSRANAAVNAMSENVTLEHWHLVEQDAHVIRSIAKRFQTQIEIQRAHILSACFMCFRHLSFHEWSALEDEIHAASVVASRFPKENEIQRARAMLSAAACMCFVLEKKSCSSLDELKVARSIAARFPLDEIIKTSFAECLLLCMACCYLDHDENSAKSIRDELSKIIDQAPEVAASLSFISLTKTLSSLAGKVAETTNAGS